MLRLRLGRLALLSLPLAGMAVACGTSSNSPTDAGSDSASSCSPGRQVSCPCAGGGQGIQVCKDDGSGYGPCGCPDAAVVDAGKDATMFDGGQDTGTTDSGGDVTCDCVEGGMTEGGQDAPTDTSSEEASTDAGTCSMDGGADAGPGGVLSWAENFGKTGVTYPTGIAIDPVSGDVLTTGYFIGTTNFGGGLLSAVGDSSSESAFFVAKFDSAGTYKWANAIANPEGPAGNNVAVDGSGNVLLAGYLLGTMDFGCGAMSATGTDDIFLVSLTSAGACSWSKHFGVSGQSQNIDSLAIDASGNIVIGGVAYGGLDFGGGPLTGYFMAKFSSAGVYSWSKAITASCTTSSPTLTVDSSGNVVLSGCFSGSADFGGGALVSGPGSCAFVAKYDGTGSYLWANKYPGVVEAGVGGSDVSNGGMSTDGCGNIFVTGNFGGTIDFGAGALTATDVTKTYAFLAKISPAGTGVWSKEFVGSGADSLYPGGLAVAGSGGPVIEYGLVGSVDFGGGALTSTGASSVAIAAFDANGTYRWSYGGGSPSTANSSGAVPQGVAGRPNIVAVVGAFGETPCSCTTSPPGTTLVLGGKTLSASSAQDLFLGTFSP